VAIFVLGHLALHANGAHHQLLFFWAPFVLLHLGGQDTMTAFSMQDNELWTRHLLGLLTQVAAAVYVVSKISWPDRRLRAAMLLMFSSGCFKYVERTWCLYKASPTSLRESSLAFLRTIVGSLASRGGRYRKGYILDERFSDMLDDGRLKYAHAFEQASSSAITLVSDTPINDTLSVEASQGLVVQKLQTLKSNKDRYRVYNYINTRLILVYERLYTKALVRLISMQRLDMTDIFGSCEALAECNFCFCYFLICNILLWIAFLVYALIFLFPFLSTLVALMLFKVVEKGELYSRADVTVSYILLIGALVLEVASLFISIQSYVSGMHAIHRATKQWSEMLGQYNMIKSFDRVHENNGPKGITSFVPRWIGKHIDDKTSHISISEDLKKFVLDKLLDFGTREEDWNFASMRGQLALRNWTTSHEDSGIVRSDSNLHQSINDVDFPTSVLIWHKATDMLYYQEDINNISDHKMKKMSRELSNYIMYLVFKCGAMLTTNTELKHNITRESIERIFGVRNSVLEKEAVMLVFEFHQGLHRRSYGASHGDSQPEAQMQLLENTMKSVLPRAYGVAQELIDIHKEAACWDLVAAVWVEILYYIAPRCGGAFHSQHLASGGEFITHVLLLMQLLGPFLPPPSS
jgi:hypothetical protein